MLGDHRETVGNVVWLVPPLGFRPAHLRGNLFPVAVKPTRNITFEELDVMRRFCNTQFGEDNWWISREMDYLAFRSEDHLVRFLEKFCVEPA